MGDPEPPPERGGRTFWSADTILRHGRPRPPERAGRPLFRAQTGGGMHPKGMLLSGTEPEIRLYDTRHRVVRVAERRQAAARPSWRVRGRGGGGGRIFQS